MFYLENH